MMSPTLPSTVLSNINTHDIRVVTLVESIKTLMSVTTTTAYHNLVGPTFTQNREL